MFEIDHEKVDDRFLMAHIRSMHDEIVQYDFIRKLKICHCVLNNIKLY